MAGARHDDHGARDLISRGATLADYEELARARFDEGAHAYFNGGAGDETTLRWNRSAFSRLTLLPRVLRRRPADAVTGAATRIELLGRTLEHPIIVAPVAYQRLAHPEGELATALGAGAQQALMILSCQASTAMAEVAAVSPACRWFQLYLQPCRAASLELVRRAEDTGYEALVVTVDAPVEGVRDRQLRTGFRLPTDVRAVNLANLPRPPRRTLDENASLVLDGLMALAPDWDDITWLKSVTRLPIVLKGILAPDDVEKACSAGVDAIIVSNHGGRTLDTSISTIEALPMVVAAVAGRAPVLLDGGVRRGTDVLKAIALGARAVLIGRPVIHGLAVAGAAGVSHVLRILRDEFEIAMALAGSPTVGDIGPHVIFLRR